MSTGAEQASRAPSATYRLLRELGSRRQHTHAAMREASELVVMQRFVRRAEPDGARDDLDDLDDATMLDAEAMALLLRDARCLAKNWHPNIARVRHVDLTRAPRSMLTVASELIDGATLEDLVRAARPERTSARDPLLALPVLARILLDVLVGLHALHGLRDGMNAPLGAIHGELCPANVVVGKDGVARIVNVLRPRPVRVGDRSEAMGYAAPEALDGDGSDDPRCDLYAVGVMLWEGLAGRRLYDERDASAILARQREGELTRPSIHPSSPFARLADVAMRALSFDPALRYRSVTEMAADLRKIAGTKLATGAAVAARVADLAGDRIRMRRSVLEPATSGTRRRASERSIAAAEDSIDTARQAALTPEEIALAKGIPVGPVAASRPTEEDEDQDQDDAFDVDVDVDAGAPHAAAAAPPSTEHLIAAALATTTAQMRAVAIERAKTDATPSAPAVGAAPAVGLALGPSETPRDFVIPVDVSETWNQPARAAQPRRSGTVARVAVVAALVLGAMGAFLALRPRAPMTTAPTPGSPLPPSASLPVPTALESASAAALPTSSAVSGASGGAAPSASASAVASSSVRAAARAVAPAAAPPPPPPAAKPKKSIYDPDGL